MLRLTTTILNNSSKIIAESNGYYLTSTSIDFFQLILNFLQKILNEKLIELIKLNEIYLLKYSLIYRIASLKNLLPYTDFAVRNILDFILICLKNLTKKF